MSALDIVWSAVKKIQPASEVAWHIMWPPVLGVIEDAEKREAEGASEEEVLAEATEKLNEIESNPFKAANAYGLTPEEVPLSPEEVAEGLTQEEKLSQMLLNEGYEASESAIPGLYGTARPETDPGILYSTSRLALEDPNFDTANWAAVTTGNKPMIRGAAPPRDTLGFQDVPYIDYIEGSLPASGNVVGRELGWQIDEARLEDGQSFIRGVERNLPFTVRDAMALYDAQDPKTKKLIAESLAIGTGDKSYMKNALGNEMFSNPDRIYDRESVMLGLMEMGTEAAYLAGLSGGGMDAYDMINLEIPKLRKQDFTTADMEGLSTSGMIEQSGLTMDQLTDELFDLASNVGVVKQVALTHSRALASDIYRRIIGRQPDELALKLFDGWALEAQKNNMGISAQPTDTEFKSYFSEQIMEETKAGGEFEEEKKLITAESAFNSILKSLGGSR